MMKKYFFNLSKFLHSLSLVLLGFSVTFPLVLTFIFIALALIFDIISFLFSEDYTVRKKNRTV